MPTSDAPNRGPLVALSSDFGLRDWYVAAMKASVLRHCSRARLIDVTHVIEAGDILAGTIAMERAIAAFGEGTVHLAVIDPGVGTQRRLLVTRVAEQLIVCPDNGLITWAWRMNPGGRAWELTWRPEHSSATFHGRDIMGPVAGMLAAGASVESLARPIEDPILLDIAPTSSPDQTGLVIHIDQFGNAMTNIPEAVARMAHDARVIAAGHDVGGPRHTYADVPPGDPLALIGSSGLLEIAVRDGSAAKTLGIRVGTSVHIQNRPATADRDTSAHQRLRDLDKRYLWHPFTHMKLWLEEEPLVIVAAEGMHLIDADGRRYLDGVSSLWCNVHGHRVPRIDHAIRAQLDKVAHSTMLGLASEPAILLGQRLVQLAPPGLCKVFYSDSGAAATEIAIKIAVQYWHNVGRPEKTQLVGLSEAYHGDTVGAMSVGRMEAFHRPHFPLLFPVHFAPSPFVYRSDTPDDPPELMQRCLAGMEAILRQHHQSIAAIMLEPLVQGAAGIIVHPPGFLAGARRLATRYDVLLIADEVATGFGRTGAMFACEQEQVAPDMMCLAKGISGGYLPLAATLATQRIFDAFLGEPWEGKTFFHGHTYTGNPLACAAALASLDLFESTHLLPRVRENSLALAELLAPLRALAHVGDIRQKGLMVGIELVADKSTRRPFDPKLRMGAAVCQRIRKRGIILRPLGDVIVLMPPLAMELDDLRSIVDAVAAEVSDLSPA